MIGKKKAIFLWGAKTFVFMSALVCVCLLVHMLLIIKTGTENLR